MVSLINFRKSMTPKSVYCNAWLLLLFFSGLEARSSGVFRTQSNTYDVVFRRKLFLQKIEFLIHLWDQFKFFVNLYALFLLFAIIYSIIYFILLYQNYDMVSVAISKSLSESKAYCFFVFY